MQIYPSKPKSKSTSEVKMLAWPFIIGPMILLMFNFQHTGAILNCFTPNMFKMGKLGQHQGPYVGQSGYGAERANWYPQQAVYQQQYGAVQHPMKWVMFSPYATQRLLNFLCSNKLHPMNLPEDCFSPSGRPEAACSELEDGWEAIAGSLAPTQTSIGLATTMATNRQAPWQAIRAAIRSMTN